MRDSLVLGVGTGIAAGAVVGHRIRPDQTENAIKGAIIGGIVSGVASYIIHGSLERRDAEVRRDTLMNLEQYEVMGIDSKIAGRNSTTKPSGKCYQTREVDGRTVSIPCYLINETEGLR